MIARRASPYAPRKRREKKKKKRGKRGGGESNALFYIGIIVTILYCAKCRRKIVSKHYIILP